MAGLSDATMDREVSFKTIIFLLTITMAQNEHVTITSTDCLDNNNHLSVTSFNCRGIMSSCLYVDSLLRQSDIVCLQEHHLFDDNKHFMSTISREFDNYTVCASYIMANGARVRQGGVSVMWRKGISLAVKPLYNFSDYIQVLQLTSLCGKTIFLFNVYLPAANHGYALFQEAMSMLTEVYHYYSHSGLIILCGDFNASVRTGERSLHSVNANIRRSHLLERFLSETNQISLVTSAMCRGPLETYYPYDGSRGTQIDHILMCVADVTERVVDVCVHGDHELNTSDHAPVSVIVSASVPSYNVSTRGIYRWDRADPSLYEQHLNQAMSMHDVLNMAMTCETDIDNMCDVITICMIEASNAVVPKSEYCAYKKPYWNADLRAMHVEQKRLRRVWIDEGRPRGHEYVSFVNYKKAKHVFAKALKSHAYLYEQNQFHDISMSCDMNIKQFWKYVRGHRKQPETLNIIHDENGTYDTPEAQLGMWKQHFMELLNETELEASNYDNDFKMHIEDEIQGMRRNMSKYEQPSFVDMKEFSVEEVQHICESLPIGKAPGVDRLTYEHIKYGGPTCMQIITTLFNGILRYVHIPPKLKEGLLITLHKGHGKPKDNKNSYRGVTLLPVISKTLEKCIHNRMKPYFDNIGFPPPLQNASRKGINNVMVSFMVNEGIYSHTEKGGKVFACLLDIEKCFDKLWWSGLMYKMRGIGLDNKLWFLMYEWLKGSSCRVYVNGQISEPFTISRSIKQGGILSMLNLCIFMCDIHEYVDERRDRGLKCNDVYVGSPSYADDLMLMSGTKQGLDKMMCCAWDYSRKWRFTFSPSKSKCMVFGESKRENSKNMHRRTFMLGEHPLQEVNHYSHLGVTLCSYDSSNQRTTEACAKGNRQLASLHSGGARPNGLYPYVCSFLWNRVCLPSMLHGCELWTNMCQHEIDELEQTQSRNLRRVQNLPPRTHSVITRGLLGQITIAAYVQKQKLMFLQKLIATDCTYLVKQIFLSRLYESINNVTMKGFIPDVIQTLDTLSLKNHLLCYMRGGRFPVKHEWKQICRQGIRDMDYASSRNSLRANDVRYARQMDRDSHMKPHPFYNIMKRSQNIKANRSLLWMIRTVALPDSTYHGTVCNLCNKDYTDIVEHIITDCPLLYEERNILWSFIVDEMDVELSVMLTRLSNRRFTDTLCGRPLSGFDHTLTSDDNTDKFYIGIAMILQEHFHKGLVENYEWLRDI
jgi:exonuclease III